MTTFCWIVGLIKNPLVVAAVYVIITMLVLMMVKASPDNMVVAGILLIVYFLLSPAIMIIVLIDAFRESIFTGFLSLFLPFYILYFVYGVSESAWVKCLFTANILVQIMVVVMIR